VSALAFLTPDAPGAAALSPMHRLAQAAGARMQRRDGWELPVAFGDGALERERARETVGFADRSSLCKLELHAKPDALAEIVARASGGLQLELGMASRGRDGWWCPLTPARALVLGEAASAAAMRAAVEGAAAAGASVVDLTCGLAAISLLGPGCEELLARFCAIDVRPAVTPVGGFRPGSVARTPGYVLRAGEHELLVLVGWALGEYVWRVVADAAEHLGGGPVGADALDELRERRDA
jgi:heterotetrameric sarcosine oxidase gamma subunit